MHEVSIIKNIVKTLEENYEGRMDSIVSVEIEAGLLSNVQPILIQNAYEALILDEPKLADVELKVKQLPIIAYCENCDRDFEVVRHKFVCDCGAPSREIVQGDELRISKVAFKNLENDK